MRFLSKMVILYCHVSLPEGSNLLASLCAPGMVQACCCTAWPGETWQLQLGLLPLDHLGHDRTTGVKQSLTCSATIKIDSVGWILQSGCLLVAGDYEL